MAWPPDVADGQVIAASHINAIRNSAIYWQGDVNAQNFRLLNILCQAFGATTPDSSSTVQPGTWYAYATVDTQLIFRMRGGDGIWRQAVLNLT